MKRIIILLLVFCCFRFSYAEELTTEQQQMAWKFIYYKALSKDNRPTVYIEDIVINLKGKVTPEDSVVVKDIIKDFQKAIPHLKITLSKSPGNLILGLDFNKITSITSNLNTFEILSRKSQFSLPDNLTSYQRKQSIYYQLCNAIVFFNYNSPEKILGLNGCVFAEKDFDSITFSPFDLFILEKLYSPDFSIQLAQNLPIELQKTAWNSIKWLFMGKPNDPLIYGNYIFIKLVGDVSQIDSAFFKSTINELEELLPPENKIVLTDSDANMTFSINTPEVKSREIFTNNGKNITSRQMDITIPKEANDEQRKKIIYYNLYRSLVHFSPTIGITQKVDGCVFNEEKPEAITFHPIDKFILSKLYAFDFESQFKANWISSYSIRSYYSFRYFIQLDTAGKITGILLAIFLLSILIRKGVYRFHNWKLNHFILQIIWAAVIYDVYYISSLVIKNLDFQIYLYNSNFIGSFVFLHLTLFFVPLLFFFIERKLNRVSVAPGTKLLLLTANSVVLSFLLVFTYFHFYMRSDLDVRLIYSIGISIAFASIRFLLFTFSELKKNELRAKDNELALLKEKNKQAELQSLRAKINPHFLYNALNSIASLATTDARKTEQMALALSDFFKYAINREQKQLNTLSEELNAIRTYLEIEKVRFGDRLSFEIDCPAELLEIQIPQLLIQPLVENAIKHGLSQITENGLISILVCKEANQLKIRVYDNGPVFPDGPLTGFGIQNTQERIALLYGTKASINWQNGTEKYIELCLPVGNEPV